MMRRPLPDEAAPLAIPTGSGQAPHRVHLYTNEHALAAEVAAYVAAGLRAGDGAMVVATAAHWDGMQAALEREGIDVEAARRDGRLRVTDAEQALALLLRDGAPDAAHFDATVAAAMREAIARAATGHVRAYGEMVDILSRRGDHHAALAVEQMWTDLQASCSFEVLCGYALASFRAPGGEEALRDVCAAHPGSSLPPERVPVWNADRTLPLHDMSDRQQLEHHLLRAVEDLRRSEAQARLIKRRMAEMQEVTARFAAALTLEQVVDGFSALGARMFGAAMGVFYTIDGQDQLRLQGAYGLTGINDAFRVLALDAPLPLTDAVRERRPIVISTYEQLITRYPVVVSAKSPPSKLQAIAALPLVHGPRALGGVVLAFDGSRDFDEEERDWLMGFAAQISVATARALSYSAEQAARADAERLLRVAESLNSTQLDLEAIVQKVTEEATAAVGAKFGAFFYNQTNAAGDSYVLYTVSGAPRHAFDKFGLPRSTPLFGPTFRGEGIVRIADVRKDHRFGQMGPHHGMPKGHLPVTSYLAVPVISRSGTVLGGLFFAHPDADRFTEQHERIAAAIASTAAAAVDNARLYRAANDSEAAQRRLVDELTETVRLNETLAGVLAHDLRNPLNGILAAAELARAKSDAAAPSRKPLDRVIASGRRMERMIAQLLDVARVRVGQLMPLDPKPCDLEPIIRHVVEELNDPTHAQSIVVDINGDTRGQWDSDRLAQVFSNLVGNALQHRSGGIVRVAIRADADGIRTKIHNEGAIPGPVLPHLFEAFTGGERRHAKSNGLGLGLFITRQIALAHGGKIEVDSNEAEGTTFTVNLPRFVDAPASEGDGAPRPLQEAKERVWQSEQRMRLLVDSIRDCAVYMLDTDGRVATWNRGAERLKGFHESEILGKHFSLFFSAEDIAADRPAEELRLARGGGTFETEGWRVRKDGTRFWANVMIGTIRDTAGTLIGFYKVTRDLTERRQAEQSLRESENRLRLIVDGVKDYAIYMLDPDGTVRTWNPGAEATKGYTRDEIVGRNFSLFFPPELQAAGRPAWLLHEAARLGRIEDENWRIRKDGSRFWADVVITALRGQDGELIGYAKVVRDLTERRRTDDALRRSEERFRLMVDAVKDYAIFMLDPSGHVATWNAGAQRLKQYEAPEIIGHHFSQFYPEDIVRTGLCERELEVAAREGRFEDEGWRVRKDGSRFWANVVITAMRGSDGILMGFAKVTRDLTDRRRLEEERVRLAQAEEAIRLRDEFLSIVSHELKTPLAGLQMQLEMLEEKLATGDERIIHKLKRATASGDRLIDLVESLLDMSRIATGRFELNRTRMDLGELVVDATDAMLGPATKAGCELASHVQEGIVGDWDRVRLHQVVTNLLSNAIKYGAGHPIAVRVSREGADIVLEVRDHGPGINVPDPARLFDRFERASSTRHYGGLGIGLYLVREITHAHGGAVAAQNAPDGGAVFAVRLPVEEVQQ